MSAEVVFTMVKQIACALFSLILPFLGIGRCEMGAKGPESAEAVRVMSFNVRCGEFDREEIVPQLVADYMPDSAAVLQRLRIRGGRAVDLPGDDPPHGKRNQPGKYHGSMH